MSNLLRNGAKLSILPFFREWFGFDKIERFTPTEANSDRSVAKDETGWDRIKRMFEVNEFGDISYEANSILQCAALSMFIGGIYGGTINSKNAYMDFMRNNEATKFKHQFEAKRLLQDRVTIAFGKGAFKFGWRVTLFATTFVGITTLVQTYRGTNGIIEYVGAGGLAGFIYKFNMGPKAWIAASTVGSALGLVCGGITWGFLKLTGISIEETRYWQYQWRRTRKDVELAGKRRRWEDDDFALIKLHDQSIGKKGHTLANLDSDEKSMDHPIRNTIP
ncbi:hypothetical protein GWI33_003022 [Rhynchophorus ferrugineus]|uniref:Complex I assembly factor TIMMDC1, mitochondrial n=1 Tax=Rhynchophorus ferrugineus TaxID=354439 RepID=A0A834IY59_RHYFE|nr:hypothetical protein GWI33_003022 [Rhynchophorus ferrugineus]